MARYGTVDVTVNGVKVTVTISVDYAKVKADFDKDGGFYDTIEETMRDWNCSNGRPFRREFEQAYNDGQVGPPEVLSASRDNYKAMYEFEDEDDARHYAKTLYSAVNSRLDKGPRV